MVMRHTLVALCALVISAGTASAQRQGVGGQDAPRMDQPVRAADMRQDDDAQAFAFETGLEEGASGRYELRYARDYSEQMGEDESTLQTMSENHTIRFTTTVATIARDGSAIVEARIDFVSSRVETADGPTSVVYDLTEPVAEDAQLEGVDRLIPVLMKTVVFLGVDANGNVTNVTGLDPALAILADSETPDRLLAVLSPETLGVNMSKLFNAEGGVEHSRNAEAEKIGAWSTLEEIALGGSGRMLISRVWEPKASADGTTIEANGSYALTVESPETPNDAAPTVDVARHTGTGRLLWRAGGGLEYLTSSEDLALILTLGASEVRSTQTSTTSIRRAADLPVKRSGNR